MLLVKNCRLVIEGHSVQKNILIGDDGKIEKIKSPSEIKTADEIIDAKGTFALPGLIDVHVHCREPGTTQKEDFATAGMAAAAGGVTTMLDMPNSNPPTTTVKLLDDKRSLASRKCIVNFGFYLGATPSNIDEIRKAGNVAGIKVYMGSSTGSLLVDRESSLQGIFSSGKMVAVHAENEDMIRQNTTKLRDGKITDSASFHLKLRNNKVGEKDVERAISIARNCNTRLHVCHLSSAEEAAIIRKNKESMSLSCEVTPHHLFLTAKKAKQLGNFAKVNPPLRTDKDVAGLWSALSEGVIDMIATDHAPHLIEEKENGYWEAPSGMPGLETMLPLLLDAVNRRRISLQQLINMTSSYPASIFRIKNKGLLKPGFDADIVLVDMKKQKTIKNDGLFTKCGWSAFNGWKVKGTVHATIANGNLVYDAGQIINKKIKGREVKFS